MLRYLNKKINNRKGFTLIELVVVVAILGILTAVAAPTYFGQQDRAKAGTNKANLNTIQNAVWMYKATTGELPDEEDDLLTDEYLGTTAPKLLKCTLPAGDPDEDYAASSGEAFVVDKSSGKVTIDEPSTDNFAIGDPISE